MNGNEMKLVPFEPWHISAGAFADQGTLDRALAAGGERVLALTGIFEDRIAFVGGAVSLWPGVAECWAIFAPAFADMKESFACRRGLQRVARRFLDNLLSDPELRRLQASARADDMAARRWVTHLGFHSEGLMPRYGCDGSDHIRYGRLF